MKISRSIVATACRLNVMGFAIVLSVVMVAYSPQTQANGTNVGAQVCQLTNQKHASRLVYRPGYIRNTSRTKYVTVICPVPTNRLSLETHYMQVVFEHHLSNLGNSKPFVVVFQLVNNLGENAQSQRAIVDLPGELYALDTTDDDYNTTNFTTPTGGPNWIPTVQISIPPLSRVLSLFYNNR